MDIQVIENLNDMTYQHIDIYNEYTIIKNCKINTLCITTYTHFKNTIKCVIILNCKIKKLVLDESRINMLYIIDSNIDILKDYGSNGALRYESKICYIELYKSVIKTLDLFNLNIWYFKYKFKINKIIGYELYKKFYGNFNYKKLNKRLFYSF